MGPVEEVQDAPTSQPAALSWDPEVDWCDACFWSPLAIVDLVLGCGSLLAPDVSGLKDGYRKSGLEMGFLIPVFTQSILTWTLPDLPSPLVRTFLE